MDIVKITAAIADNRIRITDHADEEYDAGSEQYMRAIQTARHAYPAMVIFAGLEWNIPPWEDREHATVLIAPSFKEGDLLRQFKLRFDDIMQDRKPTMPVL